MQPPLRRERAVLQFPGAPSIIRTFLESYDFAGKTIVLFATSGGSGFGRSLDKLPDSAPGATILEGFHVSGSSVDGA